MTILSLFALTACSAPVGELEGRRGVNLPEEEEGTPASAPASHSPPTGAPVGVEEGDAKIGIAANGDCTLGLYCGGNRVIGDANTLYRCNPGGVPDVVERCASGCTINPGKNDACGGSNACAIQSTPAAAYLKYGLHPDASDALAHLGFTADRITQTIGSAAASAGTHDQDGVAEGRPYSAATDLSISELNDAQVADLLDRMTAVGFIPYYRKPGFDGWGADGARHLHVVWAGAKMKATLRAQAEDWRVGKNALVSHTPYQFKTWTQCWRDSIYARFLTAN